MVIKKAIAYVLITINSFVIFSQNCGTISINTSNKIRKYYLSNSSYMKPVSEKILTNVKPEDSAIVRLILENGIMNEDFPAFFKTKEIMVSHIDHDKFFELPRDSVKITKKEKRLIDKYDEMLKIESSLLVNGKSTETIYKKLQKPKFVKVHNKFDAENPYLFKMYPIYTYKDYTLIMYSMHINKRRFYPFIYEIYKSN
jgi:hypothetical protein